MLGNPNARPVASSTPRSLLSELNDEDGVESRGLLYQVAGLVELSTLGEGPWKDGSRLADGGRAEVDSPIFRLVPIVRDGEMGSDPGDGPSIDMRSSEGRDSS